MANELEDWLTYAAKGTGIAVGTPFLAGLLSGLWASVLGKQLFALGTTSITPALFVGAAGAYFLVEMLAKAFK